MTVSVHGPRSGLALRSDGSHACVCSAFVAIFSTFPPVGRFPTCALDIRDNKHYSTKFLYIFYFFEIMFEKYFEEYLKDERKKSKHEKHGRGIR